jgi:hypothetical protein
MSLWLASNPKTPRFENLNGSLSGTQVAKQLRRNGATFCSQENVVSIISAGIFRHYANQAKTGAPFTISVSE